MEKSVESSPSPWVFRSTIQWSFRVLMLAVVVGLTIFWGFDVATDDVHKTHHDLFNFNNFTTTSSSSDPVWVSPELDLNYSSNLLSRWLAPGGEPCQDSTTEDVFIHGLDQHHQVELSTGVIHEYVIRTLDASGEPRCLGGDYFEIDLSSDLWKSRPPIHDFGNGTYSFSLQVHPDFSGHFNLTIFLLFRHFQGLKLSPQKFCFDKLVRLFPITFISNSAVLPPQPKLQLNICQKSDFNWDVWAGRWTRHGNNPDCLISKDGRFRCLQHDFPCKHPWCDGKLGSLESNGWVYSAHCSFKLFDPESAWKCLNNRWLFFWGDSNHCDTIRNMLIFVLNVEEITAVPRLFDMNITNPVNPSQSVRITSVFNGHYNHTGNYLGLNSLTNHDYRQYLKTFFSGETVPDTLIMNSGLHDGVYWPNLRKFIKGAHDAAAFWAAILDDVRRRNLVVPEVIYRTTVATGGYARSLVFNPSKMEAFNGVFVDKLREFGVIDHVVDHFDMTYPWHYDNRCNDGVHYGRAPAKMRWRDGQIGHQYFVDLMLCHVLLNVFCSR